MLDKTPLSSNCAKALAQTEFIPLFNKEGSTKQRNLTLINELESEEAPTFSKGRCPAKQGGGFEIQNSAQTQFIPST